MVYHPLVYLTIGSPIIAFILWYLPLKGVNWYVATTLLGVGASVYFAVYPIQIVHVTLWMHYYCLYGVLYLVLFGSRFNFQSFHKALAITLFTLFIVGDLWEIPVFIYDYIFNHGFAPGLIWWMSHIRRVYTIAAAVLLAKLQPIKLDRLSWGMLGLASVFTFIVLLPWYHHPEKSVIARLIYFFIFGLVIYRGIPQKELTV